MSEAAAREAQSRKYNVAGVLRLTDGTYAFFEAGYRFVEAGITVERLIELLNNYEHDRALYQAQVKDFTDRGGEVKVVGRMPIDLEEL